MGAGMLATGLVGFDATTEIGLTDSEHDIAEMRADLRLDLAGLA